MLQRSDAATHTVTRRLQRAIASRSVDLRTLAVTIGTSAPRLSALMNGRAFGRRSFPLVKRIGEAAGLSLSQSIRKVVTR